MDLLRNWVFSWVVSGLLLGIGFVIPSLWVIGLSGGVFFLYLLFREETFKQKVCGAWLAWTTKAAFSVGWLWSTYPIVWLPLELSEVQLVVIGLTWLLTAATLGAGVFILVAATTFLKKYTDVPRWSYYILIIPLLWIISESFGSLFFSLFFNGAGGFINSSFSFGYVGYLLAGHQWLLPVAKVAGVYGLTFLFVFIVGGLFWLNGKQMCYRYVALGIVVVFFGSGFIQKEVVEKLEEGYSVIAIDTYFDAGMYRSEEGRKQASVALATAVEKAMVENPDYILLPEDSRYFDQTKPMSVIKNFFEYKYGESAAVIIDSSRAEYNGETVMQSFTYNGKNNTVERYHKRYLVPIGEFLPATYIALFQLAGYGESLRYLSQSISYRVGPWTSQKETAATTPAILFCFESFSPRGIKTLTEERSEVPFVAHIASHAWFHEPLTLWSQMEIMLRVQAVWSGQYVVSVGNMMSGKVYTPAGAVVEMEILERSDWWEIKQIIVPRVKE